MHDKVFRSEQTTRKHAHLYAQMEAGLLPTRAYGPSSPRTMPTLPSAAEFSLTAPTEFKMASPHPKAWTQQMISSWLFEQGLFNMAHHFDTNLWKL